MLGLLFGVILGVIGKLVYERAAGLADKESRKPMQSPLRPGELTG